MPARAASSGSPAGPDAFLAAGAARRWLGAGSSWQRWSARSASERRGAATTPDVPEALGELGLEDAVPFLMRLA